MTRTPILPRRVLLLAALAVSLLGCPPVYFASEGELFVFQSAQISGDDDDDDDSAVLDTSVYVEPWHGFRNLGPILSGTTLCWSTTPAGGAGLGGDVWPGCFDLAWTGAVTVDGLCHTFAEGESSFTLTPTDDCVPIDTDTTLAADLATFLAIGPEDLELVLVRYAEMAAVEGAVAGTEAPWPTDWPAPFETPLRVVAGQPVLLHAGLYHPEHAGAVAFNSREARLTVESLEGDAPEIIAVYDDPAAEPDDGPFAPTARLILTDGSRARMRLDLGGNSWTTGEIVGVPESAIETLEVVPAYAPPVVDEDDGSGGEEDENPAAATGLPSTPMGARALALDADGHEILGADVGWSVGGTTIQVVPGPEPGPLSYFPLPGNDYVWLNDGCLPPEQNAGQRRATLKATLPHVSGAVVLNWEKPEAEPDPEYERPLHCTGGCSCDATDTDGASPAGALALFLFVGAAVRRRQLAAPGTRTPSA